MLALELAASDRTPKRQLAAPSRQDQPKSKASPYPPRLSAGATPQRRTIRMNVGPASKARPGYRGIRSLQVSVVLYRHFSYSRRLRPSRRKVTSTPALRQVMPDSLDEMASGQLRAPIPFVMSISYAGSYGRSLTD